MVPTSQTQSLTPERPKLSPADPQNICFLGVAPELQNPECLQALVLLQQPVRFACRSVWPFSTNSRMSCIHEFAICCGQSSRYSSKSMCIRMACRHVKCNPQANLVLCLTVSEPYVCQTQQTASCWNGSEQAPEQRLNSK